MVDDADRLRGRLPLRLDARTAERAARSDCDRYRTLAAVGAAGADVLTAAYGPDAPPGASQQISPFSRAIGFAFEHHLFDHGCKALCDLVEHHDAWRPAVIEDLRDFEDHARAERRTTEVIEQRLETGEGPDLVLGARLALSTAAGVVHVHPDLLTAPPGQKYFRIGEIKSYLDLDGRTDGTEVATAVRQAAVSAIALRQRFGREAAGGDVDLVFRLPRRPGASLRRLDATVEIATIDMSIRRSPTWLATATALTGNRPLTEDGQLRMIPHRWAVSCHAHCALAEVCRLEAHDRDDIALLGDSARRALEGVASISRATELACGAAPVDPDEDRVADALAAGWAASAAAERSVT